MSAFAPLDARLAQFAAAQSAVLTRDRHGESLQAWGPHSPGFEERRIDWQRAGINLAVIIQPDFAGGVDTSKWHFYALAWQNVASGSGRRLARLHLLDGSPFSAIETRLDELLAAAGTYLNALQRRDLQPQLDLQHQREVRRQRAARRLGPESADE
jgi:hypothetical protein